MRTWGAGQCTSGRLATSPAANSHARLVPVLVDDDTVVHDDTGHPSLEPGAKGAVVGLLHVTC
jgi:hypothetical protein